eukprot:3166385-Alexandrium_andersonii.AAC.1
MDASGWVDFGALRSAMKRNNCTRGSKPDAGRSFYDKAWIIWSLVADAQKEGARRKQRFEFAGVFADPDDNDA